MIIISLCIFTCASSHGQKKKEPAAAVSADFASLVHQKNVCLGICHSFTPNWSAEGSASLHMNVPYRKNQMKEEHNANLSEKEDTHEGNRRTGPEFRIGVRYWHDRFLKGTYLGLCCSHNLRSGTDMAVECGYAVCFWKCLGMSIGYEIKLIDSIRNGLPDTKGITIRLNIAF